MKCFIGLLLFSLLFATASIADDFKLSLRTEQAIEDQPNQYRTETTVEHWDPSKTAVIICDVWDAHHSLNAVRRLEEFAPRMNEVVQEARRRGATIIHSPSDCMPSYEGHPARLRAVNAPVAANLPEDIAFWCSRIPSEETATYPVDQSDGGDDDDPAEHAPWAEKLKAMGRNPALPWKAESALIEIDAAKDYISDRGDEVWNVLEQNGITHVILVGVHTNMCVLGRPFGLRQMVRHGKRTVLMRDMTDCMYNPRRWPHVDHFTGNDLVIRHVERHVCPTITSDQILGGNPFVSKYDTRTNRQLPELPQRSPKEDWSVIQLPGGKTVTGTTAYYRCVIHLPSDWVSEEGIELVFGKRWDINQAPPQEITMCPSVWFNGQRPESTVNVFRIPREMITLDDANLLVVSVICPDTVSILKRTVSLHSGNKTLELKGGWEHRFGYDDESWSNMPLPPKFGGSTDIFFEPKN